MRRLFAVTILLCLIYFIGGWGAVLFELMSKDAYLTYAGVIGSIASVVGLFALTRPGITQSDVQALELDSLKSMAATAEQLKQLELARTEAQGQISNLEQQRKEMELLVKKASLALFLKEQHAHYEHQVLRELASNAALRTNLEKESETAAKLRALNEEIDASPHVKQLQNIIASATTREVTLTDAINDLPPIMRGTFVFARALTKAMENLINLIAK